VIQTLYFDDRCHVAVLLFLRYLHGTQEAKDLASLKAYGDAFDGLHLSMCFV
jgi:hypothetical protein